MHDPAPLLSVITPTHNRRERLQRLLGSLAGQTAPADTFEVVVCVDGSIDGTVEMLRTLTPPFALRVVEQRQQGQAAATNHAVQAARGRFCLFLDDDMVADPGLVDAHLRVQIAEGGIVGVGRLAKLLPDRAPVWARVRAEARERHYEGLAAGRRVGFLDAFGGNLSMLRELHISVGGLSTDAYTTDAELGFKLEKAGARFVYIHDAYAQEDDRETLRQFLVDVARRGADGLVLWRLHPQLLRHLLLGGASEVVGLWGVLLRLLLVLRVPPYVVGIILRWIPHAELRRRWYRLLFQHAYWSGVRKACPDTTTWRSLRAGFAILTYHAIAREGEESSRYIVSRKSFERQMRWLKRRRYAVLTLSQVAQHLREARLLPPRSIVVTFDDGYRDNIELALPVLERHGFALTLFLATAAGGRNQWDTDGALRDRPLIDLADARDLVERVDFGAHTRTHPMLTTLAPGDARQEVDGSKRDLELALGRPITIFSYPYGDANADVRSLVAEVGFHAACTVERGQNRLGADPFALRRFDVRGTDSLLRFIATLWLRDDRLLRKRRAS